LLNVGAFHCMACGVPCNHETNRRFMKFMLGMHHAMRIRVILLAMALLPALAQAQSAQGTGVRTYPCALQPPQSELDQIAYQNAPVFWFGPGEMFFPTLPFYMAVDRSDNNHTRGTDFQDPDEIAPLKSGHFDLATADTLYLHQSVHDRLHRSVVFYRTRTLTDEERTRFWKIVKSDRQMVNRLDDSRIRYDEGLNTAQVAVVEYYSYYVSDRGLTGHKEDIEFVFVFVPLDEALRKDFRVIVGAGHTNRTPNNVLVQSGVIGDGDRHPNILVELGGHASAPDAPPLGEFQAGHDVNWHPYDMWGVRDFLATGGGGYYGNYEGWKSFPRAVGRTNRLLPPNVSLASPDYDHNYGLLPVSALNELYDAANPPNGGEISQRLVADKLRNLSPALDSSVWSVCGLADELENAVDVKDILRRIRSWGTDLRTIREHKYYRSSPEKIFKRQLYRPIMGVDGWPVLLRAGVRGLDVNNAYISAGVVLPAMNGAMRVPGFIELQAGIQRTHGKPAFLASMTFQEHWNRFATWYIEGSAYTRSTAQAGFESTSKLSIGGGVALQPVLFARKDMSRSFATRLRIGINADPRLRYTRWDTSLQQTF
jgi:hypothetical protein